jgi:transcriptional regulator GlxA family with amidase domain
MSICTRSIVLAHVGVLNSKKPSTNKNAHIFAVNAFPQVQWMMKGRWTVDSKFSTDSGITAGMDMMAAFLLTRYDHTLIKWTHAVVEFEPRQEDDDPFTRLSDETTQQ